jgi:putative ABC transport system permease protein
MGVLRATGMTPPQLGGYVTLQTGLMGVIAGLLSLPLGYALAYVLVFVINKRSFGWTLQLSVSPEILLQSFLLAVAAAVLAGLYPAWTMARSSPALALREE